MTQKDREQAEKLRKTTEEDIEVEKRVAHIMSNAQLLKGKEYLDFILQFLQGKEGDCCHEITKEQTEKMLEALSDADVVYYFNEKHGFKTLTASLQYNANALELI